MAAQAMSPDEVKSQCSVCCVKLTACVCVAAPHTLSCEMFRLKVYIGADARIPNKRVNTESSATNAASNILLALCHDASPPIPVTIRVLMLWYRVESET